MTASARTDDRPSAAFDILVLAPWCDAPAAIASSGACAGGVGVLDLERAPASGDDWVDDATSRLRWIIDHAPLSATLGVRVAPSHLGGARVVLGELRDRDAVIILTHPDRRAMVQDLRGIDARHRVLCEIHASSEIPEALAAFSDLGRDAALIAAGHECGGAIGDETTFVLVQRLLASAAGVVFARGGFGVAGAAACRAAGVAGIVLDDQLLLTPESPLAATARQALRGMSGQETIALGPADAMVRVLDRPASSAVARLKQRARDVDAGVDGAHAAWQAACREAVGWRTGGTEDANTAWPIGQAATFAESLHRRFGGVAAIVTWFQQETARRVRLTAELQPLAPGSALAASHGTAYPIVQGPMTRVSDVPAFAAHVAGAGALPLIALAVLGGEQARPILAATRDALGSRPWGVGVLGFIDPALKQAQLDEIRRVRPPFALVAGGRPDDAAPLEAEGIATYLHVPVAALLKRFIGQGARRFVFEGRECGGHVGPLCSLPLWESMVEALLQSDAKDLDRVHVLFAGGIHDARSAAMVATIAAPLAAKGIRCGVLMGTAYLFTREAVDSGAITERYQQEAIQCDRTVLLVSGVGHANRVAATPFTDEYQTARRALIAAGRPGDAVRDELERLTLGRLRLASKGVHRAGPEAPLTEASDAEQSAGGIFMLGQVAGLRHDACSVRALHDDVSAGSTTLVHAAAARLPEASPEERDDDARAVAIVGLASLVPGATLPETLWRNLLDRANQIREVPIDRWDVRLVYDPNPQARDRVNSKWGGFVESVPFDPVANRIPPAMLPQICSHQLLALEMSRQALADAGYDTRPFDRENTGVIIGVAETGGMAGNALIMRTMLPFVVGDVGSDVLDRLPEWTGESFPGMLGNVTAGRIANLLDLGGTNFCVDGACATSLYALDLAAREIREGRSEMVLAGGVDTLNTPFGFTAFAKTQALSPTGDARVFDKTADGIVCSEGAVMAVLKSVAAARRDGDRIYTVLRGQGTSADGRGAGITAPQSGGQRRAIERALADARVDAASIELYEAHGTGTPLGDRTEISSLDQVLRERGVAPRACAIGSAKSLLGHTKAAAGMVGLAKAAYAIRHRTLPPHAGVTQPIDALADPASPLALYDRARPWFTPVSHPRRAGVNAFGFGGTNGSIVIEAAGPDAATAPGADAWPAELFLFAGADAAALASSLRQVLDGLKSGAVPRLRDLAASLASAFEGAAPGPRAAIVSGDVAGLTDGIERALTALERADVALPPHVMLVREPSAGRVALLFPGQGSQAPHMASEHAIYFDEVRASIEAADAALSAARGGRLSDVMYPPAAFSPAQADAQKAALSATDAAQPAIGAISAGVLDVLLGLGVHPSIFGGHSYGELTALYAAGAIGRREFVRLSAERGRAMAACCGDGGMLAIATDRAEVERLIAGMPGIGVANHNGPNQTVVSGTSEALGIARQHAERAGHRAVPLPVAGAFHSPLMANAAGAWREALAAADIRAPRQAVFANVDGDAYPADAEGVRARLAAQLTQPVEFVREIQRMHDAGARVFVEVGPGAILTRLASTILERDRRDHVAVATDPANGRLDGFLRAVGLLAAHGVATRPSHLFDNRDVRVFTLDRLAAMRPKPLPATSWWLTGQGAKPQPNAPTTAGRQAFLTADSPKPVVAASVPAAQPHSAPVAAPAAAASLPANGDLVAAYSAYQETMRAFLALQEQVMGQLLGAPRAAATPTAVAPSVPTFAPLPVAMPAPPPAAAVPPPAVAPAPAEAPALAPAATAPPHAAPLDLAATLLGIFAAETGYPTEMLGLDLDLAADLGVDSIRQVQALGALVDALPSALKAAAAPHTDALSRARTLREVLDTLRALAPEREQEPERERVAGAPPSRSELIARLQQMASERTGYPADLLDPAQDLEADLGVDSIRRTDLVQAFIDSLSWPAGARPSADLADRVVRAHSINEIVDLVLGSFAPGLAPGEAVSGAAMNVAAEAVRDVVADAAAESGAGLCPSFGCESVAAPLPLAAPASMPGAVLVTEDTLGAAALAVDQLIQLGISAHLVARADLESAEALERRIAAIRYVAGPIGGVLHLAPAAPFDGAAASTADWQTRAQIDVKAFFDILRALAADGAATRDGLRIVSASLMGGSYGRDGSFGLGSPTGGAAVGLLRCLALEWPGAKVRAVDLGAGMPASEIARVLVAELRHADTHMEVGYPDGARRAFGVTVTPRETPAPDPAMSPQSGWVVLAIGGARGITAGAVEALAAPGVTIVLASRTPEASVPSEPPALAGLDAAGLRDWFINDAAARGERLTPVQIQTRVAQALNDRDLLEVRSRLTRAGARVIARRCDVRDADALSGLIDEVYREHGRLDAVVHGAGVIEDSLVARKSPESFARVFDTKVNGAIALARSVRPHGLKLAVFFSSVAGRAGSPGQTDYAAANEVLTRMAWWLSSRWPHARVVSLAWGPWAGGGMATETVRARLRERGIEPIEPAAGRALIRAELASSCKEDVEIVAGIGPWDEAGPEVDVKRRIRLSLAATR